MKKWNRLLTVVALGLVVTALPVCQAISARAQPDDWVPLWGPYLTGVGGTGIVVNWKTSGETAGLVEYAPEEFYLGNAAYSVSSVDSVRELHHVALTGLSPGTTYHYRVVTGGEATADRTFTTLGGGPFTFVVYGDTREQVPAFTQLERHKLVADRIAEEKNVSFVLHTGDLVTDGDDLDEWGRFFEAARTMLDGIPIFPVPGNHENYSANYYENFGVPSYYSFTCGNAYFAMMDSNDGADLDAEAAWLANDIPAGADWKFVVCHHPLYTSDSTHPGGNADLQERWEPVFVDCGVNAVFSAHMHVYERYWKNGIHYVVLGNGGAPCYELAEEKIDGYRNSLEHTLGYARITVDGDSAVMTVIEVAELSGDNREVTHIFPPDTVFETVSLRPESSAGPSSLEISLNLDALDYGSIMPGDISAEKLVTVENKGTEKVNITLEIQGEELSLDFYRQSLYIDGAAYSPEQVICSIDPGNSQAIVTRLAVPADWAEPGLMRVTFIFWAEAP
jgi:predicted phosphodiesterase